MKSRNYLILSIMFFIFAAAFSVIFWEDVSWGVKIAFFVTGFGSGVTAGQWLSKRSELTFYIFVDPWIYRPCLGRITQTPNLTV